MDQTTALFIFVVLPFVNLVGALMAIRHFADRKMKKEKERSGDGR